MEKRVLLFNSPIIKNKIDQFEMGNSYPRIGIASICSVLQNNGIPTIIIDPQNKSIKQVLSIINSFKPDFVGIPAYTEEIHNAARTASLIKQIGSFSTVVGGPHCSAIPKETLDQFTSFDYCVVGEGEYTFLELVKNKDITQIKGLGYRIDKKVIINKKREPIKKMDELPLPNWGSFDLDNYRGGTLNSGFFRKGNKQLDLPVEGARGCPFECIFCYKMNKRNVSFKSPKNIVDEVEHNLNAYSITSTYFVEGTFGLDKNKAHEMCDLLIERGIHKKISWSTGSRVDTLDKDLLIKMKLSGCNFLGIGVESGSQKILDRSCKGINREQISSLFKSCRKIGIKTEANLIIGHPFETKDTVNQTIKFAKSLETDYANFAIMVPFPGTDIANMAKSGYGGLRLLSNDWRYYGKQIGAAMDLEQLPTRELVKLQMKAYALFHLTPRRIGGFISRISFDKIYYAIRRKVSN